MVICKAYSLHRVWSGDDHRAVQQYSTVTDPLSHSCTKRPLFWESRCQSKLSFSVNSSPAVDAFIHGIIEVRPDLDGFHALGILETPPLPRNLTPKTEPHTTRDRTP
jgi:hypothetical protein